MLAMFRRPRRNSRAMGVVRARDATVTLLSVGGDCVVAGAGGFFALGEEITMRPGDSAAVPARGHFGHNDSTPGTPRRAATSWWRVCTSASDRKAA
ncbi:hypothetical protein; putative signal peptide [Frankia alni ACN14a]|uniref:Uncharacterized protein n=1 Tax=Frankia alni (strain DSM 45986 / CECT 9034 / ACN14a) TaxID=326424 RepID=Q0RSG0_FRAAA|nr:hypothetical protein; putative signal peptide [Frankia alni ACN14a]